MAQDTMHNTNGDISAYGMACGYHQTVKAGRYEVRLSSPTPGVYDVDVFLCIAEGYREVAGWAQFEYLSDARASFRLAVSQIKRGTLEDSTGPNSGNSWYRAPRESAAIEAVRKLYAKA